MQSHYFGVGAIVGWAQAGVGAVANQSVPGPRYGPRSLELMREGASAPQALQRLISDDEHEAVRQVACVDPHGRVAAHTGAYRRVDAGDELAAAGDFEGAFAEYTAAHESHPDNAELAFWRGVALATRGHEEEARALLQDAYRQNDGWRELLRRLPAAGLFPDDPPLVDRLN